MAIMDCSDWPILKDCFVDQRCPPERVDLSFYAFVSFRARRNVFEGNSP